MMNDYIGAVTSAVSAEPGVFYEWRFWSRSSWAGSIVMSFLDRHEFYDALTKDITRFVWNRTGMHGPEHWFGLIRAWIIITVVVYGLWTLLDVIHAQVRHTLQRLTESQ